MTPTTRELAAFATLAGTPNLADLLPEDWELRGDLAVAEACDARRDDLAFAQAMSGAACLAWEHRGRGLRAYDEGDEAVVTRALVRTLAERGMATLDAREAAAKHIAERARAVELVAWLKADGVAMLGARAAA